MGCTAQRHLIGPVLGLVLMVLALSACGAAAPAVGVEIAAPAHGSAVAADEPVALTVRLDGAELIDDEHAADGSHGAAAAEEGTRRGHLHVFVDGQIVAMPTELEPEVTLPPGSHTVTVEFTDEDHLPLEPPVTDEIALEAG